MISVRTAKYEDMPCAASIMVTSFRTAFADFVSPETMDACTTPDNCRSMLEHIYQEGKMHFLMGGDQGFLCWQDTDDGAEIVAIHSLPESWGTGLGHAMLTVALKQIGDRPVFLWAFKDNVRARRFYEKHGFRWDGSERVSEFDGALEVRYVRSQVQLLRAAENDAEMIQGMQQVAFAELLERYQDYDMSPATEPLEKIRWKISHPGSYYYFILAGGQTVGAIRVLDLKDGSRKRISPLYIMPDYRGKGYAQAAMVEAERIHGAKHWQLDTILQEAGNCYLYEKMGYHQTGHQTVMKESMTIVDYEKD
jgi:GNAT superfamily N-acetyltransferase